MVADSLRCRDDRRRQIRLPVARRVNEVSRTMVARCLGELNEVGQASLKACGVRPVHRRKDRWNAEGSEYWRKNAMSPMLRV